MHRFVGYIYVIKLLFIPLRKIHFCIIYSISDFRKMKVGDDVNCNGEETEETEMGERLFEITVYSNTRVNNSWQ